MPTPSRAPRSGRKAARAGANAGAGSPAPPNPLPSRRPPTVAELNAVFGALAHEARRRILVILHARAGSMTAGEIADRFRHAWPTTTRHLAVLEEAGLIAVRRDGRNRVYTLTPGAAAHAAAWLRWSWTPAPPVEGLEGGAGWKELPYARMSNAGEE